MKFDEEADIARVLYTAEAIRRRIQQLGDEISKDYEGKPLAIIGVATGAFMFMADLVRCISVPVNVDMIKAESYGHGTQSSGSVKVSKGIKIPVEGVHILIVEDILDSGRTLFTLVKYFESINAASVSVCVLLDKKERRETPVPLSSSAKLYIGFDCPNEFVVGFGMDYQERYRSLPYIGILQPSIFS